MVATQPCSSSSELPLAARQDVVHIREASTCSDQRSPKGASNLILMRRHKTSSVLCTDCCWAPSSWRGCIPIPGQSWRHLPSASLPPLHSFHAFVTLTRQHETRAKVPTLTRAIAAAHIASTLTAIRCAVPTFGILIAEVVLLHTNIWTSFFPRRLWLRASFLEHCRANCQHIWTRCRKLRRKCLVWASLSISKHSVVTTADDNCDTFCCELQELNIGALDVPVRCDFKLLARRIFLSVRLSTLGILARTLR